MLNKAGVLAELARIEALGIKKYVIGAGAALVLMELRANTKDIDMSVNAESYILAMRQGAERLDHVKDADGTPREFWMIPMGDTDIYLDPLTADGPSMKVSGVTIQHPRAILLAKRRMGRPKDLLDIPKIEEWLAQQAV